MEKAFSEELGPLGAEHVAEARGSKRVAASLRERAAPPCDARAWSRELSWLISRADAGARHTHYTAPLESLEPARTQ